jgi:hypothetical protein
MSAIQDLFRQAQLAEATYANFSAFVNNPRGALEEEGFSAAQTTEFLTHWRIVDHIPDTASGFSATLFESLDHPGQYTFAIRGSQGVLDFAGADVSLATGGVAFDKVLSMVNYVLRLRAGSSGVTRQVELLRGATAPTLTSGFVSGVGPGIATRRCQTRRCHEGVRSCNTKVSGLAM